MKLTTNYIVYLSADNIVYCAKCRLTGKFVKRALAQAEYKKEYVYKRHIVSLMALFVAWLCSYAFLFNSASKLNTEHSIGIDKEAAAVKLDLLMNQAYIDQDYILFSELNRKRFELLYC